MNAKKPVGLWIIGVLNVVAGSLLTLASFAMETAADGALLFILGAFSLTVGIGLLNLKPWARYAAIAGYVINIVVSLAEGNFIGLAVAGLCLGYLFSEKVKMLFTSSGDAPIAIEESSDVEAAA